MKTNRENRNRRGSALMLTYFAAVVLSFMVAYGFRSSLDAGTSSEAVATTEQADYAAEYGANLAVGQLAQVATTRHDDASTTVNRDWVEAGIFSSDNKGSDQRRIAGAIGDYEFRVQVRSADLALANNTMPDSWLSKDSGTGGSRNLLDYKNSYEVLATARKRNFNAAASGAGGGYKTTDAYTAAVYGIVDMKFGDNPSGVGTDSTTMNADQGRMSLGADTAFVEHESGVGPGNSAGNSTSNNQNHVTDISRPTEAHVAAVLSVDGEDHLLNAVYPKLTLSSAKEDIVGAQRGQLPQSGQSIVATGGYWAQGDLTLNFMADSRPVKYKEILTATTHRGVGTPARPNPYVPLTRTFTGTYTNTNTGHNDRQMTSKYKQFTNKNDFYTKDFYQQTVGSKAVLPVAERLSPTSTPPLELDRYFLGGKKTSASTAPNGGNGRSVTLQTFNGGEVYSAAKDVLDDVLYKGTKSGSTYSGVIAQKNVNELIKIDDPNSKLDVLVGSYVDLKRFYMTYVPTWRTVFVGEWTNDPRYPKDSQSSADNMLFDNNGGTLRKRSFSKHYPMNKDGKILVHEMKWHSVSGTKIQMSNTGTSGKARIWTGRYKWVKPNFKNKFWVLDENGQKVYPREFTWEEITGQKSKRATTGKLSGSTYGTYEAEVNENGELVAINKIESAVVRDGYPVTDILGREVPEVKTDATKKDFPKDKDGNPIIEFVPAGLTEYCSVDANDPSKLIPVYFNVTGIDVYGVPEAVKQTGKSPIITDKWNEKTRQFARRNFIEVVEGKDAKGNDIIRYYNDISDFEYRSDITLEDGTVEKDRRVATIAIGMEDNNEGGSDFDYTDIMFVLNVVPAEDTTATVIRGDDSESSKFIQWWELPPDAGLTGGPSQTPISSTETPASKAAPVDERIAANYEYLVGANDITATSFLDGDAGLKVSYQRIAFDGKGGIVQPDDASAPVYYYLAKVSSVAGNDIDPDTYDDILEFISQDLQNDGKNEYKDCNTDLERKQRGLARLLGKAGGLILKDLDERDAPDKRTLAELPDQPTFTGSSDNDYLYRIREERYTSRRQASLAFGGSGVAVAVGKTDAALNREQNGDGAIPAVKEQHLFLAGEVAPKQSDMDVPQPRQVLHRIMLQPKNSYVPDRFVANGGALDRLVDYGVFDTKIEPDENGAIDLAKRSAVADEIAKRSVSQGSLPSLFLSAKSSTDAAGNVTYDTGRVMDLVYSGMLPAEDMDRIRDLLRIDEERGLLGWHRGGDATELAVDSTTIDLQDSYVAAMLTADGLQPYTLANPAANDMGEVVAKIRHEAEHGDNTVVTHLVNVDTGNRLPTFTFDKPFDGAGILVVNGNLVVKSTFSYYGLVIVLGDVIVEPAEGDYYRRDKTGNFLDADGNRIYRGANSEWFRLEDNVDDDGTAFKTKVPANAPEKTPQYKGELMIQGKIFVGGDIEVRYVSVLEQTETREGHKDDNGGDSHTVTVTVGSHDNTPSRVNSDLNNVNDNGNGKELDPNKNNMSSYERHTVNNAYAGVINVVASRAADQMVMDRFTESDTSPIGRFLLNKPVWNTNSAASVGHIWANAVEQ